MDDARGRNAFDRFQQGSNWTLVVFGSFLLLSGVVGVVRAAVAGEWPTVALYGALMLILAAGVARGVRQLGRARRRSGPSEQPPGPTDQR